MEDAADVLCGVALTDECSLSCNHSFVKGGKLMTIQHTHPVITDEERLDRLKDIQRLFLKQLQTEPSEKRSV